MLVARENLIRLEGVDVFGELNQSDSSMTALLAYHYLFGGVPSRRCQFDPASLLASEGLPAFLDREGIQSIRSFQEVRLTRRARPSRPEPMESTSRSYVPAAGKDWLLPLYDPIQWLLG
ncbi:MAG TPA: hypothetical protein VKM54_26485, partial [Myxococcota bacterium]|nr:hypothetical protein [Myxococcota bacterium]